MSQNKPLYDTGDTGVFPGHFCSLFSFCLCTVKLTGLAYRSAFLELIKIIGRWASVASVLSSSSVKNLVSGRI